MPPALTPKVPLTAVANQGTEEMATTVQVRACKDQMLGKKSNQQMEK